MALLPYINLKVAGAES